MIRIQLTVEELKIIHSELFDKVLSTQREMDEKNYDSAIIEAVEEQLEKRRKIITYLYSKMPARIT